MRNLIFIALTMLAMTFSSQAQIDDQILPLSYVPQEILDEWRIWKMGDAAANVSEMTEAFMAEFGVPQSGLYGFNLDDTWYMWISNNPDKIERYIDRKKHLIEQ